MCVCVCVHACACAIPKLICVMAVAKYHLFVSSDHVKWSLFLEMPMQLAPVWSNTITS